MHTGKSILSDVRHMLIFFSVLIEYPAFYINDEEVVH